MGIISDESNDTTIGIIGYGAIEFIITDFAAEGKLNVDLKFYDHVTRKAEKIALKVGGTTVMGVHDMLDQVEAASPVQ